MILKKFNTREFIKLMEKHPWIIFIVLAPVVFFLFRNLFNSYFEADEWFWFTHFFPLTSQPNGFIAAIAKSITGAMALSQGQHIAPIGIGVFFLNTFFFGLNFTPYVIISLSLHALNSFLVFLITKELLGDSKSQKNFILATVGGIFFALSAVHMHAVTWVAFYGLNVLSVTFFILTILFLAKAFNKEKKEFLYLSSLFLLLGLLTKETTASLLLIIPFFILISKRIFPIKSVIKIFTLPLVFFISFRFVLPIIYLWANNYVSASTQGGFLTNVDFNLLVYRIGTFPLKMISEVFFSYNSIQPFLSLIAPIVYPQFGEFNETVYRNTMSFVYGPGINLLVYILSIVLIFIIISLLLLYHKKRRTNEFRAIFFGFFIIIASSLPLVLNVLNLQWWGIDFFDSRHYYIPSIGAAILFPFIVFNLGESLSKFFGDFNFRISSVLLASILFLLWFSEDMRLFQNFLEGREKVATPRKEILVQMKTLLPRLSDKTIIYTEPPLSTIFQTNIVQMLTILYYNNLPSEFYDDPSFWKKPEGYEEFRGKGFGYYFSKKELLNNITNKKFPINSIYGFYYDDKNNKLSDITSSLRVELDKSLKTVSEDRF